MASISFKKQVRQQIQCAASISQIHQSLQTHEIPIKAVGLGSNLQSCQKFRIPADIGIGRNGKYGLDLIIRLISWGQNFSPYPQNKGLSLRTRQERKCNNFSPWRIIQKTFALTLSSVLGFNLKFIPFIASTLGVVFSLFPSNIVNQIELVELVLAQMLQDGGNLVWGSIHPYSRYLATCIKTLISIKKEHNQIQNDVQSGKLQRGNELEKQWRACHKKAAQKVKSLMRDLHDPGKPPLKRFFSLLTQVSCNSFESTESTYFISSWSLSIGLKNQRLDSRSCQKIVFQEIEWSESKQEFITVENQYFQQQNLFDYSRSDVHRDKIQNRSINYHSCQSNQPQQTQNQRANLLSPKQSQNQSQLLQQLSRDFENLNLFGRGDHSQNQNKLSINQSSFLVFRGIYLFLVFVPFFIVITQTLVLKIASDKASSMIQRGQNSNHLKRNTRAQQIDSGQTQEMCWKLLLLGCRWSGAAFIKWGQWSCTREDLFPKSFCRILSELHDNAPKHSFQHTRQQVEAAFNGKPLEKVFVSFEEQPIASGSIAQVHRAQIQVGNLVKEVAVKVCHPGVCEQINDDFQILKAMAGITNKFRGLRSLNLHESVANFSHTMTAQTDLRVEAVHILNFENNFKRLYPSIRFPKVLFSSQSVLIESFEQGSSVAAYIQTPQSVNTQIVSLGVDSYLKMLLLDNLVHTDLHPGNILVDENDGEKVNIVLLDCGLAEELTDEVRFHFISFLNMIVKGDGERAAQLILNWGSNQQDANIQEFTQDICQFFDRECNIMSRQGIDLDGVMKGVLRIVRKHSVSVDSKYAALVIGVCVLVGFATSLDKNLNLMDAAAPCLLYYNLTGQIMGRLYG